VSDKTNETAPLPTRLIDLGVRDYADV